MIRQHGFHSLALSVDALVIVASYTVRLRTTKPFLQRLSHVVLTPEINNLFYHLSIRFIGPLKT